MNGKAAKMLRRMHRDDRRSKRVFNSLTSIQKGQLRRIEQHSMNLDVLKEFE